MPNPHGPGRLEGQSEVCGDGGGRCVEIRGRFEGWKVSRVLRGRGTHVKSSDDKNQVTFNAALAQRRGMSGNRVDGESAAVSDEGLDGVI